MKWNTEWRWWLLKLLITTATIISSFEKLFFHSSDHLHSMFDENIFGAFLHFFPSVLVRNSAYLSLLWVNSFIISTRLIMPKKQRNPTLLPEKRLPLYIEATYSILLIRYCSDLPNLSSAIWLWRSSLATLSQVNQKQWIIKLNMSVTSCKILMG